MYSPIIDELIGALSVEITYDNASGWELYINGMKDEVYSLPENQQFNFTTEDILYPTIYLQDEYKNQIEILEMKNQLFNKIEYTDAVPDWSQEYSTQEDITITGNSNGVKNDITYSDASLDQEIIFTFDDGIPDIDEAFSDLRLWTDLEYNSSI